MLCIDTLLIKLDLNKAIRIRSNDEVDLRPINHDDFLHIVNDIGQLRWDESFKTAILLSRSEVSVEDLLLVEPLCTQQFFFTCLIWVIMYEVRHDIVFLFFLRQETIMVLPGILVHSQSKGTVGHFRLVTIVHLSFVHFLFQKHFPFFWFLGFDS